MESRSRRAVLGALAGSLPALAGCSGVLGRTTAEPVRVLCAGSLQKALLDGLDSAVAAPVQVEARGSAAAARLVADGVRDPDVVALADTALFESVLDTAWYTRFATNELVISYDGATDGGRRIADADTWFEPILAGDATLGRTDPNLDPLGYRTLFALELGADHYDRPDLRQRVRDASRVYPETSLLARLDTGAVDAAMTYRNMAVDHGFDTRELPAALHLGDPAHRERYRTVSYTLSDGTTVTGDVIEYGATCRHETEGAIETFEALVGGAALADRGFGLPARYPAYEGDVPDRLAP